MSLLPSLGLFGCCDPLRDVTTGALELQPRLPIVSPYQVRVDMGFYIGIIVDALLESLYGPYFGLPEILTMAHLEFVHSSSRRSIRIWCERLRWGPVDSRKLKRSRRTQGAGRAFARSLSKTGGKHRNLSACRPPTCPAKIALVLNVGFRLIIGEADHFNYNCRTPPDIPPAIAAMRSPKRCFHLPGPKIPLRNSLHDLFGRPPAPDTCQEARSKGELLNY